MFRWLWSKVVDEDDYSELLRDAKNVAHMITHGDHDTQTALLPVLEKIKHRLDIAAENVRERMRAMQAISKPKLPPSVLHYIAKYS